MKFISKLLVLLVLSGSILGACGETLTEKESLVIYSGR